MCGFLTASRSICSSSSFSSSLNLLDHGGPDETKVVSQDQYFFGLSGYRFSKQLRLEASQCRKKREIYSALIVRFIIFRRLKQS